jgi:hypothetical protein
MRHRKRFLKQPRLRLPDGTVLGSEFSKRVLEALDRAFWHRKLPRLRRNFIRFRASDGSIHDIPRRFISQAFTIDQVSCWQTGRPQNFRILENAALKEHDRDLRANLYRLLVASVASTR